jgi:hypothetical protein
MPELALLGLLAAAVLALAPQAVAAARGRTWGSSGPLRCNVCGRVGRCRGGRP